MEKIGGDLKWKAYYFIGYFGWDGSSQPSFIGRDHPASPDRVRLDI